jgi:hypothetical protein
MVAGNSDLYLGRRHWLIEATSGPSGPERHYTRRRSTRWPSHRLSPDHVHVEMRNAVLRVAANVQDQAVTALADALGLDHLPCHDEQIGDVFGITLAHRRGVAYVAAWNDQDVSRSLGADVAKRH